MSLAWAAAALRARNWQAQSGISHLPWGDFSLSDPVPDTACMLGRRPVGTANLVSAARAVRQMAG